MNRRECVYKRTDEPSAPFYEKGGTVKRVTDFLHKKIGTSITCSDVEEPNGLDDIYILAKFNCIIFARDYIIHDNRIILKLIVCRKRS